MKPSDRYMFSECERLNILPSEWWRTQMTYKNCHYGFEPTAKQLKEHQDMQEREAKKWEKLENEPTV